MRYQGQSGVVSEQRESPTPPPPGLLDRVRRTVQLERLQVHLLAKQLARER